jgi:hypothetical protein
LAYLLFWKAFSILYIDIEKENDK